MRSHRAWLCLLIPALVGGVACGGMGPARSGPDPYAPAPSTGLPLPSEVPELASGFTVSSQVEGAQVARVVDGDTVEVLLRGHRVKVRVLGIDSCERDTPGGPRATRSARGFLPQGGEVTLAREIDAPDQDRWGRLLRYITLPGGTDLGIAMVSADHTGVYAGRRNDASPAYLARLREADRDGRDCAREGD